MSNNINVAVLIRDFLIERKTISLEKIGHFYLKGTAVTAKGGSTFPEIEFQYDKTTTTTPDFIEAVAELYRKSKVIVQSDIDYFLEENRQLMNIGTGVLVIPGIGYVLPLKTGGYYFSQQPASGFYDTDDIRKKITSDTISDRTLDTDSDAPSEDNDPQKDPKKTNTWGRIIILLILVGIGLGIYYFYFLNPDKLKSNEQTPVVDTAASTTSNNDTAAQSSVMQNKKDTTPKQNVPPPPAGNVGLYKFVFEITKDPERAHSRISKLKANGNNVEYDSVNTTEGLYFRLYTPVPKTAADTARIRDSLSKHFQKPVQIAKHN